MLKLCALAGLAKVGTIALDGTKVKANASRHKAMSYDRMKEEEKRLKEEIARLLAEAEADRCDRGCGCTVPIAAATNCPTSWRGGRAAWPRSSRPRR